MGFLKVITWRIKGSGRVEVIEQKGKNPVQYALGLIELKSTEQECTESW